MSATSTAAYLAAIEILNGGAGDQVYVAALDAVDLDAICAQPRAGSPTDDSSAWSAQELQRWHVESRIDLHRRRGLGGDAA